jgi:hypothetical protein
MLTKETKTEKIEKKYLLVVKISYKKKRDRFFSEKKKTPRQLFRNNYMKILIYFKNQNKQVLKHRQLFLSLFLFKATLKIRVCNRFQIKIVIFDKNQLIFV